MEREEKGEGVLLTFSNPPLAVVAAVEAFPKDGLTLSLSLSVFNQDMEGIKCTQGERELENS